jgi:hypothetical protein
LLGRRKWFDDGSKVLLNAGKKGMVQCWVQELVVLGGFKKLIGCHKLIWWERKKTNLAGAKKLAGTRISAPTKSNFVGTKNWHPDSFTGQGHRRVTQTPETQWLLKNGVTDGGRDRRRERDTDGDTS